MHIIIFTVSAYHENPQSQPSLKWFLSNWPSYNLNDLIPIFIGHPVADDHSYLPCSHHPSETLGQNHCSDCRVVIFRKCDPTLFTAHFWRPYVIYFLNIKQATKISNSRVNQTEYSIPAPEMGLERIGAI